MQVSPIGIDGAYVIEFEPHNDERVFFSRIFCRSEFSEAGIFFEAAQISQSFTKSVGVIRGLHFQKEPKAENKIIQCVRGKIYDVVVDLRRGSQTFGKWVSQELSEENKKIIFIPKGCAHGFQTLTENCLVIYFMDEFYSPEHASGIRWDDPFFKIDWLREVAFLSPKDRSWPLFKV